MLGWPELNRSLSNRCPKTASVTGYQLSGTIFRQQEVGMQLINGITF